MLLRTKKSWELPASAATDEAAYVNRRDWLKRAGFAGLGLATSGLWTNTAGAAPIAGFPAARNEAYQLDRAMTPEMEATTYTNFYEFGSSKNIWRKAKALDTDPWLVTIDGLVDNPMQVDAAELLRKLGNMQERLYRHRCVEAWAMAVPWTGVPMADLVKLASPKSNAKYLRMETFLDKDVAPGQRQSWYPWPYVEGLSISEAMNDLAFLGTGIYGKPLPNQNGAPIRLVVPWKYGFKSIKSVTRFTFTEEQPVSFWQDLAVKEYGFWANVNPDYKHPRWSQANERMLGTNEMRPTEIFNGYAEQVQHLYEDQPNYNSRDLFF